MSYIDITLPISVDLPVWPGDPAVSLVATKSMLKGDPCNLTQIQIGVHTGTHIDAPLHFLKNGSTVNSIPLDVLMGPCLVVEVSSTVLIAKNDLQHVKLEGYRRIVIKTKNSRLWSRQPCLFEKQFIALSFEAAEFLVE